MLKSLIVEDTIGVKVHCRNWEDAIKAGTSLLINKNIITQAYEDAIFKNFAELGPYMVIAPGIVLSHARPENSVKTLSMSLVTLEKPIEFGSECNDPVELIITLAAIDSNSHIAALKDLMDLFMNAKDLTTILKASSKQKILDVINKY
ncbi:PTS ascorbate transporter subunit IIA [Clostridium polyendosporum]|uniref:Ascorbate-specific PTS system EIIA component n=1 Tax=Clostridium polyendosporum TaxID=69208 RepID=A0A919VKL9_9CLOT|nr:PTS sugar transporter subunit IIA [Clostridium polyendosporum]GIM27723.1 PTS ascorbate transporter subunit IIA [Clostridium polyendosporum]